MNVPRSTENVLFYWEVSNSSRRTLLKRPRHSVIQMCCSLCPLVHLCVAPIGNFFFPTSRWCEQLWSVLPPMGQWMFLTLWIMCLRLGETEGLDSFPVPSANICWSPTVSTSLFTTLSREVGLWMNVGFWVSVGSDGWVGMPRTGDGWTRRSLVTIKPLCAQHLALCLAQSRCSEYIYWIWGWNILGD